MSCCPNFICRLIGINFTEKLINQIEEYKYVEIGLNN